jgi:GH43 family beta-xylosidase
MPIRRYTAFVAAGALVVAGLVFTVAPAQAATPAPALVYDFDALPTGALATGASIPDVAGSHPGTVQGIGAAITTGPRGGDDRALALPGGAAGSSAAFVEIARGLTDDSTGDVTISAWMKWSGDQECAWAYALGSSADRYLFATPRCGGNLIGAVKLQGEQRATNDGPAASTRWTHVAVSLDSGQRITTFIDGQAVASTATTATGAATSGTDAFSGLLGKSFYGGDPFFAGALDDVRVDRAALSAEQVREIAAPTAIVVAASDAAAVDLGDTSAVVGDLVLPRLAAGGSSLTWRSSDPAVVGADGRVVRPGPGAPDASVTLTPSASFAGQSSEGEPIDITVKAESADERVQRLSSSLVVPPVVAGGTALPIADGVVWSGDAVRDGGILENTTALPQSGEVTASATIGGLPFRKTFSVTVLGTDAQLLVGYTRNPTSDREANQDTVARSIHFALGTTVADAQPLQGNYGIVFAAGDYVGVDSVDQRGVADPSPFYFADGRLGFISSRVLMSGAPDPVTQTSATVFRAIDARGSQFEELGTIDLGTTTGVRSPRAVWDSGQQEYVVSWSDDDGAAYHTTVTDLTRTEWEPAPFAPENDGQRSRIVAAGNRGDVLTGSLLSVAAPTVAGFADRVADAVPGGTLPISASLGKALAQRYDRVSNTAVQVNNPRVVAGATDALEATRARLTYSDGSTAERAVDWDPAELARIAEATEGTFTVSGTVRQKDYTVPFAANRADPTIYRYTRDGQTKYLFIATDDTNNNNIASAHLPLRVADSFDALSDAAGGAEREVDLLNRWTRRDTTADGRTIAGCYWAPEIHEIGGKLSILFSPCFNSGDSHANDGADWTTVQSHIMQLRDGGDPANPDDWSKPAAVLSPQGAPLGRAGYDRNISLDMTYFEANGQAYYAWSQRFIGASVGDPLTWIAKVDPTQPTRIASEAKPVISPALSWELRLAEGAFAMERDGKIYLIYSSDGVSPRYVVGGVWADADSDLLDIDSWHKYNTPLMKSVPMPDGVLDYLDYPQGPGHGAVTTDDDGNPLYVYHTWGDGVGGNGRDTRIGRIHWAGDGRPILDMSKDEEVAPGLRSVTMTVTVTPRGGVDPTPEPTPEPTVEPTPQPTTEPSPEPTGEPTPEPSTSPTPQPSATPGPTTSPGPTPGASGASGPIVTSSATRIRQGSTFEVSVAGLRPGEQIRAELHSEPLVIDGIDAADERGFVTFRVDVPRDFETGTHTLYITRADGTLLTPLTVEVVSPDALASTGAEWPTLALLLGLGALALGIVTVRSRRRV